MTGTLTAHVLLQEPGIYLRLCVY